MLAGVKMSISAVYHLHGIANAFGYQMGENPILINSNTWECRISWMRIKGILAFLFRASYYHG